jgi:hypothetical protein
MANHNSNDPAFASVGGSEGITIWRIEAKNPVLIEANFHGKFYVGDAYLVLKATKKASSNNLDYKVHFWLGDECSVDEKGIVAYKAVELDDKLGGIAVQYRETQNNESDLFCSYFKNSGGVEYLPGGVDSGFTHVERDSWPTRLLHVKGKRNCRVMEVANEKASLNKGDVFILDKGLELFLFCGPESNKYERAKGLDVLRQTNNDSRGARATLYYLDDEPQNADFWDNFGGYVDPASLPDGDDDDAVGEFGAPKLYRVCDSSGTATTEEVAVPGGKLNRDMLDSDDAFIVVAEGNCYIWVGKKCTAQEKKEASKVAMNFIDSGAAGLDNRSKMERVADGVESSKFRSLFAAWTPPMSFKQMRQTAAKMEQPDIAFAEILAAQEQADMPIASDPGSDKVTTYTIENFELSEVDASMYGQFFSGDSYVIQYEYEVNKRKQATLFYWLGMQSTTDEKGAAALQTKNLDDTKFMGQASQVRVVQGKEPATLRALFKGNMIVHTGGLASGFKNKNDVSSKDEDGTALFHVRGTTDLNTCGVQVEEKASELNGEDCFVLVTPSDTFVWSGNAANADEIATAKNIGRKLCDAYLGTGGRTLSEVKEGGEPDAFWQALGGKADYPAYAPGEAPPRAPRLFEVSNQTGVIRMEEVCSFTQMDLSNDDTYLLDCYNKVFVWIGTGANATERAAASELSQKFVSEANDGRDPDSPVISVNAGAEPSSFTCWFQGWDNNYFDSLQFKDPYAAKLAQAKAQQEEAAPQRMAALKKTETKGASVNPPAAPAASAPAPAAAPPAAPAGFETPVPGKYSLAELQGVAPAGVEPHGKEKWLSDAEFESALKMSRAEFDKLPAWKQNNAKKAANIF